MNDKNEILNLFRRKISKELEIGSLLSKYKDELIKNDILEYVTICSKITDEKKFEYKIQIISKVDNFKYEDLIKILEEAKQAGYSPKYELLINYIGKNYLVRLIIEDRTKEYDIDTIKNYFHIKVQEDEKEKFLTKFASKDRELLKEYHQSKLNEEKSVLQVKKNSLPKLSKDEINDLAYKQPEKIKNNFAYRVDYQSNKKTITYDKNNTNNIISTPNEYEFDFNRDFKSFVDFIFNNSKPRFEVQSFTLKYLDKINDYYKIKYLLIDRNYNNQILINSISLDGLKQYIYTNPWKDLENRIYRNTFEDSCIYFLKDIEKFTDIIPEYKKNINLLAEEIFNTITPKYTVSHLRLWLDDYDLDNKFDYIGFNQCFKELTLEEQHKFVKKAYEFKLEEHKNNILLKIKPCFDIIERNKEFVIYKARLCNFFFQDGMLKLRIASGDFTDYFQEYRSSYAFNNIDESDPLNEFHLKVTVNFNYKINEIIGFDSIIDTIQRNSHSFELNSKNAGDNLEEINLAYIKDFDLIDKIKDYLYKNQQPDFKIIYFSEASDFFPSKNILGEAKNGILSGLFIHHYTPDEYAIIWGNIDFTEDRATYVFKSNTIDVQKKIVEISKAITKGRNLRSTLISKESPELIADLGYVGKINNHRGEINPFKIWKNRLFEILNEPIPIITNKQESETNSELLVKTNIYKILNDYNNKFYKLLNL